LFALHGLGGSSLQSAGLLDPVVLRNFRVIAPDLRAHGVNHWPLDASTLNFATMANDVRRLMDSRTFDEPPILMGISMGAAVALELQGEPERFAGLLIVRPAWRWEPSPANLDAFPLIASLLDEYPVAEARARFAASPEYGAIAAVSPEAARALLPQFDEKHAYERRIRLTCIPADSPKRPSASLHGIVLGTDLDPVHPLPIATGVAADTGLQFERVAPRYDDPVAHRAAIASALSRL